MPSASSADVVVIGGGIVGLATAHHLHRTDPALSIAVLEKEPEVAAHQTGRNSGVIHAGLYYKPGSLKAKLCVEGGRRLLEFCAEHEVPTLQTGKVVLATGEDQIGRLDELERRAGANGVEVERIGPTEIAEREPHARGVDGLWVAFTGSVDFGEVARAFATILADGGQAIRTDFELVSASGGAGAWVLESATDRINANVVVNCTGLHVDRVMRILGGEPPLKILPFRGEYWGLQPEAAGRIRGHIYPVPDPALPHLGVHFTRYVDGRVEMGPNAVWALGREAYGRFSSIPKDAAETIRYRGFWNLARKHWRAGIGEQWRSLDKQAFTRKARAMVPGLTTRDLSYWRSGIRAQAVDADGTLIHDFVIREDDGVVNVLNAPSPAATACLTIGEHIAERTLDQLR